MKVSDIMTLGIASVRQDDTLFRAIKTMAEHQISSLLVLDNNDCLCGIVTEGDFFRQESVRAADLLAMPNDKRSEIIQSHKVSEIMTRNPFTIDVDTSVKSATDLMAHHSLKRLPVLSGSKPVGLLSRADLLSALIG